MQQELEVSAYLERPALQLTVTHLEPSQYSTVDAYVSRSTTHPLGMSPGVAKITYEPIRPDATIKLNPVLARTYHFKESYKQQLLQNAEKYREFWLALCEHPVLSVGVGQDWLVRPVREAIEEVYEELRHKLTETTYT